MRTLCLPLLLLGSLGCEQRADVGDLNDTDAGPRDGSTSTGPALERLAGGDFDGALAAFTQGQTPSDAFGACFARTLGLVEQPGVTASLARFGLPPARASDLLGPQSAPARIAQSWRGSGQLTIEAPVALNLRFDQARARGAGIEALSTASGDRLKVYGDTLPPGRSDFRYDCSNGQLESPPLQFVFSGSGLFCYPPSSVPTAGCDPDGGSVEVLEQSTLPGGRVHLRFSNVLLECGGSTARASGELDGGYYDVVDTSGLHPLWAGMLDGSGTLQKYFGALGAGTTLDALLRPLYGLSGELEAAAVDCERAAAGSGVVFRLPGALWGGQDLPITSGDAGILAGLLRATSALLRIASAYQNPMVVAGLCTTTSCVDAATSVERFNGALPALTTSSDLLAARTQLGLALDRMDSSVAALGADSVFPRNTNTAAGLEVWRGWFSTGRSSLDSGQTALAGFTPPVGLDLARFFSQPPNPATASVDPLVVETGTVRFVESFYQEVLRPYLDLTADGSVNYSGPSQTQDPLEGAGDRLRGVGFILLD